MGKALSPWEKPSYSRYWSISGAAGGGTTEKQDNTMAFSLHSAFQSPANTFLLAREALKNCIFQVSIFVIILKKAKSGGMCLRANRQITAE